MSLLDKAQELVGKARHAAGRITGDRPAGGATRPEQSREDGQDRIQQAAQDAKDRYRRH